MPRKGKNEASDGAKAGALSRMERLLALLLLAQQPSANQLEKIKLLRSAGLTNPEIGMLLGMSGSAVGKVFYSATKRSSPKKAAKKKQKK